MLDVPGDQPWHVDVNERLLQHGYEALPYNGTFGEPVIRYRKYVRK